MPRAVPDAFSVPGRPFFQLSGVHDRNEGCLECGIFRMQICKDSSRPLAARHYLEHRAF